MIEDSLKIPCDFQKDFLKNSHNKNELYKYLARRFFDISTAESSCDQSFESSLSSIDQIFVVTHGDSILTENDIDTDGIFYYTSMEVDARVIGHVLNISVNNDYKKIFILADICRALPFFYAFSGCDTVSNIFKHTEVAM